MQIEYSQHCRNTLTQAATYAVLKIKLSSTRSAIHVIAMLQLLHAAAATVLIAAYGIDIVKIVTEVFVALNGIALVLDCRI